MKVSKLFVCCLLVVCLILAGCGAQQSDPIVTTSTTAVAVEEDRPWLDLSVVAEPAFKSGSRDSYVVPGTDRSIECVDMKTVDIRLEGEWIPLKDALESGRITPEQVVRYVRMDAAEGRCVEQYISHLGVAHFYYCYADFGVGVAYDVFVAPDGSQHLVNSVEILRLSNIEELIADPKGKYNYLDENYQSLLKEDWGVSFEAVDVSATGMTLRCTQSGGQQFGRLQIGSFMTFSGGTGELELKTASYRNWFDENCGQMLIANDGVTEFAIQWETLYGALPSGEYLMRLWLNDVYDPEAVHPLAVNYRDEQEYQVTFIIP